MQRISTPTAVDGKFVASDQVTGTPATDLSAPWFNDIQENVCKAIENEGIDLVSGDANQLSQTMQTISGKKRNLNFNPAFYITQKWGGSNSISTPISGSVKIPATGYFVGGTIQTSGNLTIYPSPNGLTISGSATGSGQTIAITQTHSRLEDATFGNDTITANGETKYFTSSVKYKKVSGADFTIKSFIGSISGSETPIKIVDGDSFVESVGMAYKQTSVNTKDLGSTPIVLCGFEIILSSPGAFEIEIKNCDFTEGLSLPDFQTYGDYIADNAFADIRYSYGETTGAVRMEVPFNKPAGVANCGFWVNIPIVQVDKIKSTDTINITNLEAEVRDINATKSFTIDDIEVVDTDIRNGLAAVRINIGINSADAGLVAYSGNIKFDWQWVPTDY